MGRRQPHKTRVSRERGAGRQRAAFAPHAFLVCDVMAVARVQLCRDERLLGAVPAAQLAVHACTPPAICLCFAYAPSHPV